ncbi:MAG: transporter substrate-binding domain-containing protein [Deltaproteobacteria bacterium]|nr:transporter substrate-binding domain-containing protein [Deltaproteobacteria bacterium]
MNTSRRSQRSLARFAFLLFLTLAAAAFAQPKPLRIGVTGDYPPLVARTGDGDYVGFDADVARAFAEQRGYALEWVPVTWPELAAALAAGRFDVAMTGVTVRADRSVAGRFTVPVAESGAAVLVRDAALASEAALAAPGVALTVNAGGHLERVARARFPGAAITALPDNSAVRDAFASGAASAVVTDTLEAPRWRSAVPSAQLVGPLTRDVKAYWLPADRAALASELDAWLLAREADGTLARLRAQWLGADAAQRRPALPALALVAVLAERLALQPHVAEAKRASGAPVFAPEREAQLLDSAIAATQAAARAAQRPAPTRAALAKFFTTLFEVSRSIQTTVLAQPAPEAAPAFDLDTQLRPALTRQTERVAALLPLLPMGLSQSALAEELAARTSDVAGLSDEARAQLAAALAELAAARRAH